MIIPKFVQKKVNLAPFTSYRVGGPADYFAQVRDLKELKEAIAFAKENYLRVFVLGKGTNLLVSDTGFRGLVIKLSSEFAKVISEGREIVAGGAAQLALVSSVAAKNSLSGLEWAAGIPGTVGGALKMNAGAHGFSISDVLSFALVFDISDMSLKKLRKNELGFGYRKSSLRESEIVLEASFSLIEGEKEKIRKKIESYFAERKKKQPLLYRSAGSVFKNPPGDFAGRLIEEAGLKGYRIGDAVVSEIHANFIVNLGNATATEIYNLIKKIQQEVYDKFKVTLEPEIVFLGEFE